MSLHRFTSRNRTDKKRPFTGRRRLSLESLEFRRVLATVTLNSDLGMPGELRTELASAAPNETIDFNLGAGNETISLSMGELIIDKGITIDGSNLAGSGTAVTISAGGNSRVLNISDGSATSVPVSISNLTITGGNSVGDLVSETGGGIRNEETLSLSSATLTGNVGASGGGFGNVGGMVMMTDVTFDSNMAYSRGGGLHNTAGGYLSITNGVISGNTVTSATMYSTVAGGLSSYGVGSAVVLTDSMVTGNLAAHDDTMYAASGLGGGLGNDYYSVMTLNNTVVRSNYGDFGGGAWADDTAVLNVQGNSQFNSNTVTERGGGIHATDAAIVNVNDSSFDSNVTTMTGTGDGGAISAGSLVSLTIDNSTFSNNYAYDRGGAIYASSFGVAPGTVVTITDSTFDANTAIDDGGAISTGQLAMTTITNSDLTGNSVGDDGGAIHSSGFSFSAGPTGAALTVVNSRLSGNLAGGSGGALRSSSSITTYILDTDIYGNSATARGGAIYTRGEGSATDLFTGKVTIKSSTIMGNTSLDDGAGVHTGRATDTTIDESTISDNMAFDRGAGVRLSFANTYPASATITNSLIEGNQSTGSGGGLYISQSVQLNIEDTTIDSNTSYGSGAGFVALGGSASTVNRSTISNGYALSTGGGFDVTNAFLVVQQSTISGNQSFANGGGSYLRLDATADPGLSINIEGSTITDNYGVFGGGVLNYLDSVSGISNSIISGNTDTASAPDLSAGGSLVVNYSLIGTNEGSALVEAAPDANGNIIGGPAGGLIDAKLGPLQDNGGPTFTHLPAVDSPAVDAGDPSVTAGTDQRGFQRVVDGDAIPGARVDMGAAEFGAALVPDGDFNGDGFWDCSDIDDLVAAIVSGSDDLIYDMNFDGMVDLVDITDAADGWLRVAGEVNLGAGKSFLVGDANLDGFVNGQDFVIWNTFKFSSNNGWCGADFNADGNTDGQDFVLWNSNKFTESDDASLKDGTRISEVGSRLEPSGLPSHKSAELEADEFEVAEQTADLRDAPVGDRMLRQVSAAAEATLATPFVADAFEQNETDRDEEQGDSDRMFEFVFAQP